ncbi:MAG: hypothetical protein RRZ69_03000, partial [Clostridia bacterium]
MSEAIRTKHYQGFRGIDLSSDPTLCHETRSPYLINMFKDYKASFGKAIETFAGFRKSIDFPLENNVKQKVFDSYFFTQFIGDTTVEYPLIHVGSRLYLWKNYPEQMNVVDHGLFEVSGGAVTLKNPVSSLVKVEFQGNIVSASLAADGKTVTVGSSFNGKTVNVFYIETALKLTDALYSNLAKTRASYFVKDNLLYIIDGEKILTFDGTTVKEISPYTPTTYVGITATSVGKQLDSRNMLSDKFKNTIVGDGVTKKFNLSESGLDGVAAVTLYGVALTASDYAVDLAKGTIEFVTAPKKPIEVGFDEGFAGIEVLAKRLVPKHKEMVVNMQRGAMFDGRLFLTKNDGFKNTVVYSGLQDYTHFPELNYIEIGEDDSKIMDILVMGNELLVLKGDSQSGSQFILTPFETGFANNPKAYKATGIGGAVGAVCDGFNFMSEPVYLSRLGVKGIASPNLKQLRAIENRSSLINSELLFKNIKDAKMFEWCGYLCVYVDGVMYLGDSRLRFSSELGEREYEWFKIDNVGAFDGQYQRFDFATNLPTYLNGIVKLAPKELLKEFANPPKDDGTAVRVVTKKSVVVDGATAFYYTVEVEGNLAVGLIDGGIEYQTVKEEYLVTPCEDCIGGKFNAATDVISHLDNIYFGNNGSFFSYNFDLKKSGELEERWYSFDGRVIKNGIATALDNVG